MRLLVAQCTHDFSIRAVARARRDRGRRALDSAQLVGERPARRYGRGRRARGALSGHRGARGSQPGRLPRELFRQLRAAAHAHRTGGGWRAQRRPAAAEDASSRAGLGEAAGAPSHQAWEDLRREQRRSRAAAAARQRRTGAACGSAASTTAAVSPALRCVSCAAAIAERVRNVCARSGCEELRWIIAEQGAVTRHLRVLRPTVPFRCHRCGRAVRTRQRARITALAQLSGGQALREKGVKLVSRS